MLEALVRAAMRSRLAVLGATIVVVIWGLYAFQGLTIEAFPDPTDSQVTLITTYTGQPAEEMERQVSIPIERGMNGLPGLVHVRSTNIFGLSQVNLTFKDGIDPYFARAQVSERLRTIEMPDGVAPRLASLSTPIGEIYRYTMTSPNSDPLELRTLQDWVVRPRILQVEGVADVTTFGGMVREIAIHPDPVAMAAKKITLSDIENAMKVASVNASGGVLERGSEQLVIRSEGLFKSIDEIGHVSVATREGTPIVLSEVASVQESFTTRQGVVATRSNADAVEGIVMIRRGENPSIVLNALREKVKELNESILEKGVKIDVFYDRTDLVNTTLKTVGKNLLEGALLVTAILAVFLMDIWAALIVAALIPLSLLSAFIYLQWRGMSANLLSLGAVDFGVIVDGAVVIVEAIASRIAMHDLRGKDGADMSIGERIRTAVEDVARPTVFAQLIIIAAYLPVLLLQRVEGRIFSPMAHTVVAALVGSLILSMTLIPVLATFVYGKPKKHRESPVLVFASRIYAPALQSALKRPKRVVLASVFALAFSVYILANRGSEFLPELNEGAMYLTFNLPRNAALNEARRLEPLLAAIIDTYPEVDARISQMGRPEDGTDPKLSSNLEVFVKLKPEASWPKGVDSLGTLMEQMAASFSAIPGVDVNFSQPIRDNVAENVSGQQGQVALKIFSSNLNELQQVAEAARKVLDDVPGATDVAIVRSGLSPQVHVAPKRESLGRFGLSMGDVQGFLETALAGKAVGTLWDGERNFDIALRLPGSARETVEQLKGLQIPTPRGSLVALGALADIDAVPGLSAISREDGQRYVGVRMNVRSRDLGSFVDDARAAVDKAVTKKPGMQFIWAGEIESKERALNRLKLVVPVALLVTLILLYASFGSIPLALLVLFNVPFVVIGGAFGLWLMDMPLSISACVGFIALVGQASLNGVLIVSAIEEHRKRGVTLDAAIAGGTSERLRAVLMTSLLAALGLIPAVVSRSMGAEMQRPIAVVIVGGTISAALLTLFVLPVVYKLTARFIARAEVVDDGPVEAQANPYDESESA
jgi:heavy metal efflux system protein